MAAHPETPRRRPRRGSVLRPLSTRLYGGSWAAVGLAVLVAAFTVGRASPLPQPELPPSFDRTTAAQYASELATRFPDRRPGTKGAREAAAWAAERFRDLGLTPHADEFRAEVAGLGVRPFVNVFAVVPGDSLQTIVVMAHRDNLGVSPGADDNASGTAALLELARNAVVPKAGQESAVAHTLVFLSTDGGVYGAVGAEEFAQHSETVTRLVGPGASVLAVVGLDAVAGRASPRLEFAGNLPRTPTPALLSTAGASIASQAEVEPRRPNAVAQALDLAFPISFYEQGALLAHGISALTLTTGGSRPPDPESDTVGALDAARLGSMGRSAQVLLASLDQAAEVARGTDSFVYLGSRTVRGWTLQLVLLSLLVPFFAALVDLAVRFRRRGIPLVPALRSLRSRLGVWAWTGGVFAFFAVTGIFPNGPDRPIPLDTAAAGDWDVLGLTALATLALLGWLVARPRLAPAARAGPGDELAGHLAAMLALGVVAVAVAAWNPYALVFVLPSLHAWLWLPHVADRRPARIALFVAGFAGPSLLLASFAVRFDMGLDAVWYLVALTSVGYVPTLLVVAALGWAAVAEQLGAIVVGRYAPYPAANERGLGPIRQTIRQIVLTRRRARQWP
jgi:hypothetical protein